MKKIICCFLFFSFLISMRKNINWSKYGQQMPVVATPESVLPDFKNNLLYVSLIDGGPWDVDGKGGIGHMTTREPITIPTG